MAPKIINITPGGYAANCYLLIKGADAVLIDCTAPAPDVLFGDGETLSFGGLTISTMLTPGHTRGSALFLCENIAFTGDTIFAAG